MITNLTIALVAFGELTGAEKHLFFDRVSNDLRKEIAMEQTKLAVADVKHKNVHQYYS